MRFNLRTLLYVVAVLAAGLGAFGIVGLPITAAVLGFWVLHEQARSFVLRLILYVALPVVVVGILFRPAVNSRPPGRTYECANNLRQVALALQMYQSQYGTLPPPYIADKSGKPMHSWRTLILPFIERADIYDAYDFSEAWNGPNNRKLANIEIPLLRCPSTVQSAGETTVFAVVGPQAAWVAARGRKLDEFTDGADETLLLIEATGQGVNWLEPKDLSYDQALALLTSSDVKRAAAVHAEEGVLHYTEFSRNVAFADGSAGRMPIGCSDDLGKALLTINGGERLDVSQDWKWSTDSRLHWPRIWGIAVFVFLAVLPRWLIQRRPAVIERDLETDHASSC
jgi:hypothetical protein